MFDYVRNPKLLREKQVHSDLFSTTHSHGTGEKEGKGMVLSLYVIHLIKTTNKISYPIRLVLLTSTDFCQMLKIILKYMCLFHSDFIDDIFNTILKIDIHT